MGGQLINLLIVGALGNYGEFISADPEDRAVLVVFTDNRAGVPQIPVSRLMAGVVIDFFMEIKSTNSPRDTAVYRILVLLIRAASIKNLWFRLEETRCAA